MITDRPTQAEQPTNRPTDQPTFEHEGRKTCQVILEKKGMEQGDIKHIETYIDEY